MFPFRDTCCRFLGQPIHSLIFGPVTNTMMPTFVGWFSHARAAGHHGLRRGPRAPHRRGARGGREGQQPFPAPDVRSALESAHGKTVRELRRLGKRIAIGLDDDLWIVLHLMIAGRLHWKPQGGQAVGQVQPGGVRFLHRHAGADRGRHQAPGVAAPGSGRGRARGARPRRPRGVLGDARRVPAALRRENHTLKRALTDPHLFSGIGNAYSDEILHRARLSPLALTQKLARRGRRAAPRRDPADAPRVDRSPASEAGDGFPEKVTAFRPRWPSTAASASRARSAAPRSSESATPTTRRTTAPAARPKGESSPTARCRGCSRTTGRGTSMSFEIVHWCCKIRLVHQWTTFFGAKGHEHNTAALCKQPSGQDCSRWHPTPGRPARARAKPSPAKSFSGWPSAGPPG